MGTATGGGAVPTVAMHRRRAPRPSHSLHLLLTLCRSPTAFTDADPAANWSYAAQLEVPGASGAILPAKLRSPVTTHLWKFEAACFTVCN